jgi:hypothetical protein
MPYSDRRLAGVILAFATGSAALAKSPISIPDLEAEKAAISALRAADNKAIASRDLAAMLRIVADDYVGVGGSDGIIRSREEARKLWAADFTSAHPANQCVRQPAMIEVGLAEGRLRAAETGRRRCRGRPRPARPPLTAPISPTGRSDPESGGSSPTTMSSPGARGRGC